MRRAHVERVGPAVGPAGLREVHVRVDQPGRDPLPAHVGDGRLVGHAGTPRAAPRTRSCPSRTTTVASRDRRAAACRRSASRPSARAAGAACRRARRTRCVTAIFQPSGVFEEHALGDARCARPRRSARGSGRCRRPRPGATRHQPQVASPRTCPATAPPALLRERLVAEREAVEAGAGERVRVQVARRGTRPCRGGRSRRGSSGTGRAPRRRRRSRSGGRRAAPARGPAQERRHRERCLERRSWLFLLGLARHEFVVDRLVGHPLAHRAQARLALVRRPPCRR